MKKILGLDIGTASIGWAIVEVSAEKKVNALNGETSQTDINNDRIGIHKSAVGVRIISQDTDNISSFKEGKRLIQGNTLTPTAKRRKARGARKMKSRYKLRRDKLIKVLNLLGMLPEGSYSYDEKGQRWLPTTDSQGKWFTKIPKYKVNENGQRQKKERHNDIGEALYKLRNDAVINHIDLRDWGRILLHLNQWRGYSSDRFKKDDGERVDHDFYTSLVVSVAEKERVYKGKKNPKVEKVVFEITFENGDIGLDIVPFGEKSYSRFKENEFSTYKKEVQTNEAGDKRLILNWQRLREDDWTYRKWKLNKGIENYINEDWKYRTVGSYFYNFFYDSNTPSEERIERIRNNVVNRNWYENEFDKIWEIQFENHKAHFESINIIDVVKIAFKDYQPILNEIEKKKGIKEQLKCLIKDKIIYFQRPWQQAKSKGECPFEFVPDVKKEKDGSFIPNTKGKKVIDKNGNEIYVKGYQEAIHFFRNTKYGNK